MGYANVSLVYARWAHLPDRPFRLLVFMALRTADDASPALFWEGREACAAALGRIVPPEPAPTDNSARAVEFRKVRRADFESVKAAMKRLMEVGAVEVDQHSSRLNNARYKLNLYRRTGQGEPVEQGRVSLSTGQGEPVEQGRVSLPLTREPPMGVQPENMNKHPLSPNGGTSPAAVDIDFAKAQDILDELPDKGAALISEMRDRGVGGFENRHIAAARVVLASRNAS